MTDKVRDLLFKVGIALMVFGLCLIVFGPKTWAFFSVLALFGATIFVHEYGHYVVMRRNGVTVTEFSVGLGPILWEWQLKSGTLFRLRLFPIGGFAAAVTGDKPGSMDNASYWAKFRIYMAGMFFNATAAFIVLLLLLVGFTYTPESFALLVEILESRLGDLSPVVIAFLLSYGLWIVTPPLFFAMITVQFTELMSAASGPIGIISMGVQTSTVSATAAVSSADAGSGAMFSAVLALLGFFAMLNVSIAGFNLLPLMPLDGGQVVRITLAKIPGRIGKALVTGHTLITMVVMLLLVVAILGMDLFKFLTGKL